MTLSASDLAKAYESLQGLAIGDAFGETWFFRPSTQMAWQMRLRVMPKGPWHWTDDTAMAISLFGHLAEHGIVHQDLLANEFAQAYTADPARGYGPSMHGVLRAIAQGEPWQTVTASQFGGQGSFGNGAAMRVAPLGVFFHDDLDQVALQAQQSAVVTHAHAEAAAGAVAVAVAAALAVQGIPPQQLVAAVAERTPDSEVASRLRRITARPFTLDPHHVAGEVGCGAQISAPDTVPYAIWCAARHLDDLPEALWATASAGGDIDTTCAIVAGIIAARTGLHQIPDDWRDACEPLPFDAPQDPRS